MIPLYDLFDTVRNKYCFTCSESIANQSLEYSERLFSNAARGV